MRKLNTIILSGILAFILYGCSATPSENQTTKEQNVQSVETKKLSREEQRQKLDALVEKRIREEAAVATPVVEDDKFTGKRTVTMKPFPVETSERGKSVRVTYMTSDGKDLSMGIRYYGSDWLFVDTIYTLGGGKLEIVGSDRKTAGGGSVMELVMAKVTADDLKRMAAGGYELKLAGKRGSLEIKIPQHQPQAFMDSVTKTYGVNM